MVEQEEWGYRQKYKGERKIMNPVVGIDVSKGNSQGQAFWIGINHTKRAFVLHTPKRDCNFF
jgi:hypothetical protein